MYRRLILACLLLTASFSLEAAEFSEARTCPVVLFPHKEVTITARVPGQITTIQKELGEEFQKDETLLTLDTTIYQARKDKAEAALKATEAELRAMERLHRDQSRSVIDLLAARRNVADTKSALVLATHALEGCTIKAPYAGRIIKVHQDEHAQLKEGAPLISIVDDSLLRAQFLLPADHVDQIKIKQTLAIKLPGRPQPINATITHIGAVIDAASGTIEVYAEIPNTKKTIRAGLVGQIVLNQLGAPTHE